MNVSRFTVFMFLLQTGSAMKVKLMTFMALYDYPLAAISINVSNGRRRTYIPDLYQSISSSASYPPISRMAFLSITYCWKR